MATSDSVRMTESRRAILDELRHVGFHPTADELYERVRRSVPRVSLGTIYRNLEYLSNHGLVTMLRDPDGRRRYDATPDHHCHVWCVKCGRVQDVSLTPSARPEQMIEDDLGYQLDGYDLSFRGVCPACRGEGMSKKSAGGSE